jgi:NADPH-dependent 2,4-dienoyl-CoA reductase/sulfur reductase-like enzyme
VSKEVVRGEKGADDIRIRKADWYEAQRVHLRTGERVAAIDVEAHRVTLASGEELDYGSLVLATGGRARTLEAITAPDAPGVRTLRDLADVDGVLEALRPGGRLVVVGAGLIGSEIAASARELGAEVTLLEAAASPLQHLLPPDLGALCAELHTTHGTDLQLGVEVTAIVAGDDGETVVEAADGRRWSTPRATSCCAPACCAAVPNGSSIGRARRTTARPSAATSPARTRPSTRSRGAGPTSTATRCR